MLKNVKLKNSNFLSKVKGKIWGEKFLEFNRILMQAIRIFEPNF